MSRPGAALRLGTRGSALARAQSELVASALRARDVSVEVVVIHTEGDRRRPDTAWGEGAFVTALEAALVEGRIDVAVHSAKDLPLRLDPRLVVAAFPSRADPRDALLLYPRRGPGSRHGGQAEADPGSRHGGQAEADPGSRDGRQTGDGARRGDGRQAEGGRLGSLPRGARVGTDSPRRGGFLLAERPDLQVRPLHGNVDTRIARLEAGESDAIVLAVAGLQRLGRAERIDEVLDPGIVPPAPGQGALAVQVRFDDTETARLVAELDDAATRAAVSAERAFLGASGGGCRAPIGALGRTDGAELVLFGAYVRPDGSSAVSAEVRGPVDRPEDLGRMLAERLGKRPDLAPPHAVVPARAGSAGPEFPRILVTRPTVEANLSGTGPRAPANLRGAGVRAPAGIPVAGLRTPEDPLGAALCARELMPVSVPTIRIEPAPGDELDRALRQLDRFDWVAVTSANGVSALVAAAGRLSVDLAALGRRAPGTRWAAVGAATADALAGAGIPVSFVPEQASGASLGRTLPVEAGQRVLLPRAERAGADLPSLLRAAGADVEEVVAYRTLEGPPESRELLDEALARGLAAIVFSSGSTVRGLLALAGGPASPAAARLRALPAVCIGASTIAEARAHGFERVVQAANPDPEAVAQAAAGLVAHPLSVVS